MTSLQHRIWLERAGLYKEGFGISEKKLTDAEIDHILKKLRAEDEAELQRMNEEPSYFSEFFTEETGEPEKEKTSSDTKGKLHELLVGYHLNNGKHMEKHPDKNGDSPQEAHDALKKKLKNPEDYDKINARAKSAAADIKKKVEVDGHKIKHIHWTSQPNDLLRTTGIKASQKEDSSDIVVTTHKKEKGKAKPVVKHHGISLKVTDTASKHVPTSNLGIKSAGPHAQDIHDEHRRAIIKKYPKLVTHATNAEQRKDMLKSNPKMDEFVKKKNTETLNKIAGHLNDHLNSLPKDELTDHIRNIIHAHKTPMQHQGHEHMRHTSFTSRKTFQHHSIDPSEHHEHIFKEPHNISVEHHGTSIHFKHNGKTFARHSIKFSSQSDPLSSIKGSGQTAGD
jgi:hypothetical protein